MDICINCVSASGQRSQTMGTCARVRGRAGARAPHGAQERDDWVRRARARARAGVTVHKNTMTEGDARRRARGRDDAQEIQKSKNREIHIFSKTK